MASQVQNAIYLDANAGARVHPAVSDALRRLLQEPEFLGSNPSSIHSHGRRARKHLTEARDHIAASLAAQPDQLVFTSSGTEANQLAIRSALESRTRPHWITTPVEHDCNREMQQWVRQRGGEVALLPVDQAGAPIVSELNKLLRPETALVSCIWVSNETGVITDVQALAHECRARGVPLHLDGAQAWGKLPINLNALGATYVGFSAHKIGGLAGTGVLYAGTGAPLIPQITGKQESGRRGGTENLLGIIAAGVAASKIDFSTLERISELRDELEQTLTERIPGTLVNGADGPRVANTLSLCFEGVERDGMIEALDLQGFSVSSGSACSSGVVAPSHVLLALGRSTGLASAGLRISFSGETPSEDLGNFTNALEKVVSRLRQQGKTTSHVHGTAAFFQ